MTVRFVAEFHLQAEFELPSNYACSLGHHNLAKHHYDFIAYKFVLYVATRADRLCIAE